MSFEDKLDGLVKKYEDLEAKLQDPSKLGDSFAKVSKEYSDLGPVVDNIKAFRKAKDELADIKEMFKDGGMDKEMKDMMEEEEFKLEKAIPKLENQIKISLLPKDEADEKNAILEVRAGTGGEEAALFAAVLFNMYQRYAERQGWKFEIISLSETGIGGYKEACASISGRNVFAKMKFESGVHRVQRVPETETQGRVHTSAATVAVLPEAEEVDIKIEEKDLRIDIFRASGPGGQSVNTTDSAVRIVHIPTGITVSQQDEKSQHKNREKGMKILRARLYEAERERLEAERSANRKGQVGSGDRSERIRTYNFPQGRVSDHRINLTLYKIDAVVNSGELDEFINALTSDDEARRLAAAE
ncbi:MAG: peptide chain release factor 1 [Proteobacteria bacterium]|nr:peptide chain release factor 1 [Pseudomonadota bacterium]